MKKLGFIGIGIMGKPMAKNLIDAGYPLVVYDINHKALEEMVDYNAKSASSCKEVVSQGILSLPCYLTRQRWKKQY